MRNFDTVKIDDPVGAGRFWRSALLCKIFVLSVCLLGVVSCKKDPVPEEPGPTPPAVSYLRFNTASAHDITVKQTDAYRYELTTTGSDPYISMMPLSVNKAEDAVVLTFEYKSTREISDLQVFFSDPISEARSERTGAMPAAMNWTVWSVNLNRPIKDFAWGSSGQYLRLDFGDKSNVILEIRNMDFRSMTAAEQEEERRHEEEIQNDLLFESALKTYLSNHYLSQISEVQAGQSRITVNGSYTGVGTYSLCEITPYENVTQTVAFGSKIPLTDQNFSIGLDRYADRDGFRYDRTLSKWVIVKTENGTDEIVSHARYADGIVPCQAMTEMRPRGKKGLGLSYTEENQRDMDALGISVAAINITLSSYMYTSAQTNTIAHVYGGKTYYFNRDAITGIDLSLKEAQKRSQVVAAIVLVPEAARCPDQEIGRLMQHPSYTSRGIFTMPNMTTAASVNCYAAALDFFAQRYCRSDNAYGRIHHWIMHNEVDMGVDWTNMGDKPMTVYMDAYVKSMRMCYNIVRQYDEHSEVWASFTHSWTMALATPGYSTKEMLKVLQEYSDAEGDFQWGLAYHSYPEDLNEPKTWNDSNADFTLNTPLITFKNLEVLDYWIKQPENKYKGSVKRTVWLSENGTNSRTYGDQDLKEQAAGGAFAWKKLKVLDGIDAMVWHNWVDNRDEYGLRIGLRKFPDDADDPFGAKPVWYVYQAAGTDREDDVFDPYKPVIGITDWNIIQPVTP